MLSERRYDVDALRCIALFLLIFYHLAIAFTSLGKWIFFIPNNELMEGFFNIFNLLSIWRLPLLFLISGIALRFSYQNRTKSKMLKERGKVLGIPYLFGVVTFVPVYIAISSFFFYKGIDIEGLVESYVYSIFFGGHLWFLINILIYSLISIPIINILSNKKRQSKLISNLIRTRIGIFIFALPVMLEGHLLDIVGYDENIGYGTDYSAYSNTDHGLLLGFIWFVIGIVLASQGNVFWESNYKNINLHLVIGLSCSVFRIMSGFSDISNKLIAFESFNYIFVLLGLGARYLNKNSSQLKYYKEALFPVYIVHLPVQMGLMYFFSKLGIPPLIKFLIVLFLVFFLSLTIYHGIKNIRILRPLFGLRNN